MQSARMSGLAAAVIPENGVAILRHGIAAGVSREFITRSNDETSSVVGSNEVLTSA